MIGAEHFKEDIQKEFLARIPAEERSQFNEMLENSFLNPVSGADGMLHLLRTETDKLTKPFSRVSVKPAGELRFYNTKPKITKT